MKKYNGSWISPEGIIYHLRPQDEHYDIIEGRVSSWDGDIVKTAVDKDDWIRISITSGKGDLSIMCDDLESDSTKNRIYKWAERMLQYFPETSNYMCNIFDNYHNRKFISIKDIALDKLFEHILSYSDHDGIDENELVKPLEKIIM
jgi:hypothetical protein